MKCEVCGRRMRSGVSCFECDGCGGTAAFVPIDEVLEVLECMDSPEISEESLASAVDVFVESSSGDGEKIDMGAAKAVFRHTPKSQKKSKGKKK